MEKNWIKLYATSDYYRAELLKQALIDADIDAVLMNKQDSSYGTFGLIEIYIHYDSFGPATEVMIRNGINS